MADTFEEAVTETAERLHIALEDSSVATISDRTTQGARIVWEHIEGQLRGAIPYPVPQDLMGVAVAAGLRVAKGFAQTGTMFIRQGEFNNIADFRPWTGFMLVERMVLNRYRKTVA